MQFDKQVAEDERKFAQYLNHYVINKIEERNDLKPAAECRMGG